MNQRLLAFQMEYKVILFNSEWNLIHSEFAEKRIIDIYRNIYADYSSFVVNMPPGYNLWED